MTSYRTSFSPLNLAIITGSTRPGRRALDMAQWVADQCAERPDLDATIVDLADHPLPHFDEPIPPIVGEYQRDATRAWAAAIDRFDGFVFVTPEYNHSIPGVLKNAIDHLFAEWSDKVAGFVTYGAHGGVRAAEHLRVILGELCVADVRTQVVLSLEHDVDVDGNLTPNAGHSETMTVMLDEMTSWGTALRTMRQPSPELARLDGIAIRSRIKPDARKEHRQMLDAVYAELQAAAPDGYHSITFAIDGDTEYLDIAIGAVLPGPVAELQTFRHYRQDLEARCEHREALELTPLHVYGLHT